MKRLVLLAGLLLAGGCESVGEVGMIVKRGAEPSAAGGVGGYARLGPASAESCRFFLFGVAPFGDSGLATVVDEALAPTGGDAIVDATVSSSLYGFMPIYNFFCYTCTSVRGTAVRLARQAKP